MARQEIDLTTPQPNGKMGEPTKSAWAKVNDMTSELYPLAEGAKSIADAALPKAGGIMTGLISSNNSLGLSVRGADFSAISIYPTGPGGRDYRFVSTDNGNFFGGGKLIVFDEGNNRIAFSLDNSYNFVSGVDNAQSLGLPSYRWSVVYAATGSINTSDAREKTEVIPFTANEISAATAIAKEIGFYKFLSSISDKGNSARWHAGLTVQRAIEVMESHGLNPFEYSFICHDSWEEVPASEWQAGTPAGDRYSFRPDGLMMFIAKGLEARISAIEEMIND